MAAPLGTTPAHAPGPPVAVLSPQFCAPYTVSLTMTKKIKSIFTDGGFTVTDSNGTVVMQIRDIVLIFRNRFVLRDAAGQPVLTMQAKIFSMHGRWEVFRGDSTNARDLLFTAKRSSLWQLKTKVDVFLAGNNTEQVCDFKMKGGYSDGSCAFYLGNSDIMIARMNRKRTVSSVMIGKHTYCVDVFPHVDYMFIVALVVILDELNS